MKSLKGITGLLLVGSLAAQTACTPAQTAQVQAGYAQGQLFCKAASGLIQALQNPAGAPVIVIGQSAQWVADACAIYDAFAMPVAALPTTAVPATIIPPPPQPASAAHPA